MSGRARKWTVVVALMVLVIGGVAAGWYYATRAPVVFPPPVPEDTNDPAVREALTQAREGVLQSPRSAEAWGELGLVFRAHDVNPQAVVCFGQAAKLDPGDPRWPYLVGTTNLLLSLGDVIPHLREAYRLTTVPNQKSAVRLRLAEVLLDLGELDEAAQLFIEELRINPGEPRAKFGLGMVAVARGNPDEAVSYLEVAVGNPAAHRKASALLAVSYRRLQNSDAAARYEKEAATSPKDIAWPDPFLAEYLSRQVGQRMLSQRANELESQRRYREAVDVLEELARNYPSDHTLVHLGQGLLLAGEFDRAEQTLRLALQKNPDHAAGHFFLGRALMILSRQARGGSEPSRGIQLDEEAVGEFRRCIALQPNHGPAHVDLGQTLQRLGRHAEAIEACREAIQINPQATEAHLALGEVLFGAGKPQEAITSLEEAVRLAPPRDMRAKTLLETVKKSVKLP